MQVENCAYVCSSTWLTWQLQYTWGNTRHTTCMAWPLCMSSCFPCKHVGTSLVSQVQCSTELLRKHLWQSRKASFNGLQALAQDQLRALRQMCAAAFGDDAPHVEVYDGDTIRVKLCAFPFVWYAWHKCMDMTCT